MEEEEEEEKIRERSVEVMEVGESAVMWEGTDLPLLASQMEKRMWAKECGQTLEDGNDKEMGSSLEPPERSVAQLTPWF